MGFLAGLVSIGGGIFLSPVLFLLRYDTARRIAAATSLFIFVNSLAGLLGRATVGGLGDPVRMVGLGAAVLAGGLVGNTLTLDRLSPAAIRRVAAVLILAVGLRLLARTLGVW